MISTKIKKVDADWTEVKNECRNTVNKGDSTVKATEKFIKNILISEHSPIRLVRIKWRWESIKSWIATHFARHWLGWDKWISTQRTDRTGVNREQLTQEAPVNMDVEANAQALINVSRYRLCYQAAPETRQYMENLKETIHEEEPFVSDVMVPNCIYRMGCPEFKTCGYLTGFLNWCNRQGINADGLLDIQARYDLYNQYFKERNKSNGSEKS